MVLYPNQFKPVQQRGLTAYCPHVYCAQLRALPWSAIIYSGAQRWCRRRLVIHFFSNSPLGSRNTTILELRAFKTVSTHIAIRIPMALLSIVVSGRALSWANCSEIWVSVTHILTSCKMLPNLWDDDALRQQECKWQPRLLVHNYWLLFPHEYLWAPLFEVFHGSTTATL